MLKQGIGVLADTNSDICTVQTIKERNRIRFATPDGSVFEVNLLRRTIDPLATIISAGAIVATLKTQMLGAICIEMIGSAPPGLR